MCQGGLVPKRDRRSPSLKKRESIKEWEKWGGSEVTLTPLVSGTKTQYSVVEAGCSFL